MPNATAALWDRRNRRVHALRMDDQSERPTGLPVARDADLAWLPLVWDYPDGYVARFPQLLGGHGNYLLGEDGYVHGTFPEADYSVDAVRAALVAEMKSHVQRRLANTDWYLIREWDASGGQPVPDEVLAARAALRERSDLVEQEIMSLPPDELAMYDYNRPGRLNDPEGTTDAVPSETGAMPGVPVVRAVDDEGTPVHLDADE